MDIILSKMIVGGTVILTVGFIWLAYKTRVSSKRFWEQTEEAE